MDFFPQLSPPPPCSRRNASVPYNYGSNVEWEEIAGGAWFSSLSLDNWLCWCHCWKKTSVPGSFVLENELIYSFRARRPDERPECDDVELYLPSFQPHPLPRVPLLPFPSRHRLQSACFEIVHLWTRLSWRGKRKLPNEHPLEHCVKQ